MSLAFSRPRLGALPVLLALLVVLPACDSGGEVEPGDQDQVFFGVNYTRLFAPATAAEIQAVRSDWAARNTQSSNEVELDAIDVAGGTAYLVSHTVTSTGQSPITHYGVVRVPDGASDLPALVVHHGGDSGFSLSAGSSNTGILQFASTFPTLGSETVQIIPVYRSESIVLGDERYDAGGSPSPWDYDVDDAIAFLDAALSLYGDAIDETRIGAIGFSRGGNTAALHAIRDNRIDALVDYYGPTDFYNDATQTLATGLLTSNPAALGLPGADYLLNTVLNPLRNADGTPNPNADYSTARLEVVRRSASLFTGDLPDTQVHHHTQDPVVPIAFSQGFAAAASTVATFEFFSYSTPSNGSSFHSPEGFPTSIPVASDFLRSQLAFGSLTDQPVATF